MNHQVLFSLKNNEKIFMNVVCCNRDWCLRVNAAVLIRRLTCFFVLHLRDIKMFTKTESRKNKKIIVIPFILKEITSQIDQYLVMRF